MHFTINSQPALYGEVQHAPTMLYRLLTLIIAVGAALAMNGAAAFSFDDVAQKAKKLSQSNYEMPSSNLPKALENLSYDQYRDIRFDPAKALWRGAKLPFEVAFFHQGLFYDHPVKINEIVGNRARAIKFDAKAFNYGKNDINPDEMKNLGFAGFRVHYPLNTKKYKDEVAVFLGASYFRALGKEQVYGISARGLALDTGLNSGEEFPQFSEFWIERPPANATQLTIYALLNSPRATGAYRFVVKPGTDTVVDVKSRLYLRENVTTLGIAPLTSM